MFAARVGDMHFCPMFTGPVPHVGGPILPPGKPTVLIGKMPAATVSGQCTCVGPPDVIVKGEFSVLIGKMPAARMLDNTAHGGMIVLGCFTVIIGSGAGKAMASGSSVSLPSPPNPADIAQQMVERETAAARIADLERQKDAAEAAGDADDVARLQAEIDAQSQILDV